MTFRSILDSWKSRRLGNVRRRPLQRSGLSLEVLEDRLAPATFTVITADDNGSDASPTPGSLREAILTSNASVGVFDTINFSIGAGVQTIQPRAALPFLTDPVLIDGMSQPMGDATPGLPRIELDGSRTFGDHGLVLNTGDSTIRGLAINRFPLSGMVLNGRSGNAIVNNFIGTDVTGMLPRPNGGHGIWIRNNGANNIIGAVPAYRNLISGNLGNGIEITSGENNLIRGNFIGVNIQGNGTLGNGGDGIHVISSHNTVGGMEPGNGNVISGNTRNGILIQGGGQFADIAFRNSILGNSIGTTADGEGRLANGRSGVALFYANQTTVGAPSGGRNLISGNGGSGVVISSGNRNSIQNNFIGTDGYGQKLLGNGADGVTILGSDNIVGGSEGGQGNVISGNTQYGVSLIGPLTQRNQIADNLIGVAVTDNFALPNLLDGVAILNAPNNIIGGASGTTNVIAGNLGNGVRIQGSAARGNRVFGNLIGTNYESSDKLPNHGDGVKIVDAPHNSVGVPGQRGGPNFISANLGNGVTIAGSLSTHNRVQTNYIGADLTGEMKLGNHGHGVFIDDASFNQIGDNPLGGLEQGNLISGNSKDGVRIQGLDAILNRVQANLIGTNKYGNRVVRNGWDGVAIVGGSLNVIGGPLTISTDELALPNNVISGNAVGVSITGIETEPGRFAGGIGNRVQGNFIGTDGEGRISLANRNGVTITNAAGNLIGGTAFGAGNIIAFNAAAGVVVGAGATGNAILRNSIHSNGRLGIDLNNDGVTSNDPGDRDIGPNLLQNFPVLTSALSLHNVSDPSRGNTTVHGSINGPPGATLRVEFFSSTTADPSRFGEGQTFFDALDVTIPASGVGAVDHVFLHPLPMGQNVLTATATDSAHNTSEFSGTIAVARGTIAPLKKGAGKGKIRINLWGDAGAAMSWRPSRLDAAVLSAPSAGPGRRPTPRDPFHASSGPRPWFNSILADLLAHVFRSVRAGARAAGEPFDEPNLLFESLGTTVALDRAFASASDFSPLR